MEELTIENTQEDKAMMESAAPEKIKSKTVINQKMKYAVTLIEANLLEGQPVTEVRWMDIEDPSARYKIYRHTAPINTETVLQSATYLGSVNSGVQVFKDKLEKSGQYYYAVTSMIEDTEQMVFMLEQSFTTSPVIFKEDGQEYLVSDLKVIFNKFLGSVFIRWRDPDTSQNYTVFLYRSKSVLDSFEKAQSATLIVAVPKGEERYQDLKIRISDEYYYAAVVQLKAKKEPEKIFVQNQNFTTTPVKIEAKMDNIIFDELPKQNEAPPEPPKVMEVVQEPPKELGTPGYAHTKDLKLDYNNRDNYISLTFQMSMDINEPFYINIYRSESRIQNVLELTDESKLLESLPERSCFLNQKFEYRDYNITPGKAYYYAVLIDSGTGIEEQKLLLLDNYIKYPVKVYEAGILGEDGTVSNDTTDPADLMDRLQDGNYLNIKKKIVRIINNLYRKGNYVYTIDKLKNLQKKEKTIEPENRGVICLYIGKSYLELGEYETALEWFHKLKKIDEDEGVFWIEKTIENY